jgi:DNA-binding transcriptional LysR family regulator
MLITLNADAGTRGALDMAFSANQLKRRPVQELGHVAAVSRLIELGLGVGVLPIDSRWPLPASSLVTRPLVPVTTVSTLLVHRRNRSLRPNAAAAWAQFAGSACDLSSLTTACASPTFDWKAATPRRSALHEP